MRNEVAEQLWRERVQLPSPKPYVAPGFVVPGKRAYLEFNAQRTVEATFEVFGQPVVITATSVFDIDWGDGERETAVTRQGGPWPDGDTWHIYTQEGPHTVTLTQRWTAEWRIGEATGRIDDQLETTGTVTLPTRELQAVRRR